MSNNMPEEMILAGVMYAAYCTAVGGVAYNGDRLPTWEEFSLDQTKQKQAIGWVMAATAAIKFSKFSYLKKDRSKADEERRLKREEG